MLPDELTTIVLNRVTIHSTAIQSDILAIQNIVENNYQYDTRELLEKHKVVT